MNINIIMKLGLQAHFCIKQYYSQDFIDQEYL